MNKWTTRVVIGVVILSLVATGVFFFGSPAKKDDKAVATQSSMPFKPLDTSSSKIVAEYNGGKLTEGELNAYVNMMAFFQPNLELGDSKKLDEFKQEVLPNLSALKYMASKVSTTSAVTKRADEEIKKAEKSLQEMKKTKDSFSKMLEGKGVTVDQIKQLFVLNLNSQSYSESKLKNKMYDYVKVRHILISFDEKPGKKGEKKRTDAEAKKLALEIKQRLEKGEDFAKLAKQYSDDPSSKDKGGVVEGAVDHYVPEFAKAAKTLPYGKISDLIKVQSYNYQGYHILKVENRKTERADLAPEEVKQMKIQEIFQEVVVKELKFKSLLPSTKPVK